MRSFAAMLVEAPAAAAPRPSVVDAGVIDASAEALVSDAICDEESLERSYRVR
jgi:hypothetical protein